MKPSEWTRFIYRDIPATAGTCYVSIWNRQTKETQHLIPPTDQVSADRFDKEIALLVKQKKDAYFGVGLRRPALLKNQRGKVADVRGLPGLFLDIDFDLPDAPGAITKAHQAKNLPQNDTQATEILSCLPPPTCIVDSGHGWHVYWLFEEVLAIGYLNQVPTSLASEHFQRKVIAHAAALGYHVDSTYTIDRILRLPGTINTKSGLSKPVTVLFSDGPRYADIDALLKASEIDLSSAPESIQTPINAPVTDELLQPRQESAQVQSTPWIKEALGKLHNAENLAVMETVISGKPFAQAGDRDRMLQKIAGIIAYIAPDRSPKELATEILGPSLSNFDDVDRGKYTQSDRIDWAAEKIERAQIDARRDRVLKERHNAGLMNVLTREARSAPRRDHRLGSSQEGPYSDAEMHSFAKQQGTTPDGFRKRWIIQKGQSFYVYVNGDYQLPIQYHELDQSLNRDLGLAAKNGYVQLTTTTAKGEPRNKTTKEILTEYCSVARTVVTQLDLNHSYYDSDTQTFYEAACPIRPLEPAYCPEVDAWLQLLGGTQANKLLDWLATITNLGQQTSALYIQGKAGTGKSLLSHGLARLWHKGAPTELFRVLGEWSADMARCPLIVADEQIPQSFRGQRTSAELRSLIGSSGRTLSRKYLSNSDLVGSIRLILSANNADMLVFDESLSQADLEAVSGRFLHITPDPFAKNYIESIDSSGWVSDDVIAKHILWLRDHRTVIHGKRFLVEGSAQEISKMLATRGGVAGRVTEWLVRYICDTKGANVAEQSKLAVIGSGRYLVNTNAVVSFWEHYVKSSKVPSTPQVGSALRNLASNQVRWGSKRYFEIDIDSISQWSEANLVGDPELIQDRIAKPLPPELIP